MPKLAVYKFLTFFIVAFDTLREPPHVHVSSTKSRKSIFAKIWLNDLSVAEQGNLSAEQLNLVLKLVKENQWLFLQQFADVKAGKKVKTVRLDR